jgi:hypothetical protein
VPRGSSAQISDSRHGKHGQGVLDTENCSFNLTVERTVNWSVPTGSYGQGAAQPTLRSARRVRDSVGVV